jgi:hypothetical protein
MFSAFAPSRGPPKGVSSLDLPDGLLSHRVLFPGMRRTDPA